MTLRRLLNVVAGFFGVTLAASVFCLPCWIPVLMALHWMGLTFMVADPIWGQAFVLSGATFTAALVTYLGTRADGLSAWACALLVAFGFYVIPNVEWLAYIGYAGMAVLLWKCRNNACKIVR